MKRVKFLIGLSGAVALCVGLYSVATTRGERLLAVTALGLVTLLVLHGLHAEPRRPVIRDALDVPLLAFDRDNDLTVRGLLANLIVCGRTGSGKSTGSGAALLRGILRHSRSGGIVLANKPEDRTISQGTSVDCGGDRKWIIAKRPALRTDLEFCSGILRV